MRSEHETDDRVGAARERLLDRLGDPGPPVPHAGEDGHAELGLECRPRRLGDLVQRVRLLDPEPLVARDQVLEVLRLDRPATADVGVVGGHVLDPIRRAVRHQDDRGAHTAHTGTRAVCSCTKARSRPSTAGSVSGMTP